MTAARLASAIVTVVLLLALPATAAAQHSDDTSARDITGACPPELVTDSGFEDVADYSEGHLHAIACILAYRITSGTTTTTYSPASAVTREQMATFLMRSLDVVDGYERPARPADAFPDDGTSVHHDNINAAATEEIATGFGDGTFGPTVAVTRAQMASFVVRMLDRAGANLPISSPDAFSDDDHGTHEASINTLAGIHVVVGTADGTYSPAAPVTRAHMALFLARSLDYLADEDLLTPLPAAPQNLAVTPLSTTVARLTWEPPRDGDPLGYKLYRVLIPADRECPSTGYSERASVPASGSDAASFDDTGLTPGATYCYRATTIGDEARESAFSELTTRSRITMPEGTAMLSATVDTERETVAITYTEAVTCAAGSARQFEFGGASPMAPEAIRCSLTEVVLTFADATGAGDLTYRQSINDPGVRITGTDGEQAISPQTVAVADPRPEMVQVSADIAGDVVRVIYSEPVTCEAGSWAQFTFTPDGGSAVKATAITGCDESPAASLTLSFAEVAATGELAYAAAGDPTFWITDEGGAGAVDGQTLTDVPPEIILAVADQEPASLAANDRNKVHVTYSEAVKCTNSTTKNAFTQQFTFMLEGTADVEEATSVSGCGSQTLLVKLPQGTVTGAGALRYTPDANDASRHAKDSADQPAAATLIDPTDVRPEIVGASADLLNHRLTLTYSEPVTCVPDSAPRFSYTASGQSVTVKPHSASCDGTTTVVLRFFDLKGSSGELLYTHHAIDPVVQDLAGNTAITQTVAVGHEQS